MTTTKSNRPLGEVQRDVLRSLKEHKHWYPNCGWMWDGNASTERRLQPLVARGLVTKKVKVLRTTLTNRPPFKQECYVLTPAGETAGKEAWGDRWPR